MQLFSLISRFRIWAGSVVSGCDYARLRKIERESSALCDQMEELEGQLENATDTVESFRAKNKTLHDELEQVRWTISGIQTDLARERAAHIETLKAAADKFSMLATRSPVFGAMLKPEPAPPREQNTEPIQPQRKMGRQVLNEWATEQAQRRYGIGEVTSST